MKYWKLISLAFPMIVSFGPSASASEPVRFQTIGGEPITFKPFKISEFCQTYINGNCEKYYSDPSAKFHQADVFDGTIAEYVEHLNEMEMLYNLSGFSLRPQSDAQDEESFVSHQVPTPRDEMKKQILAAYHLSAEELVAKILGLDPKADCPKLNIPTGSIQDPNFAFPRITIPGIIDMPADDIVRRLNEQQEILCTFGFSLYGQVDLTKRENFEDFIGNIMNFRKTLLENLDLSEYSHIFNMENVQKVNAAIDIAKDIQAMLDAKEFPSPEQLFELRNNLNTILPADMQIPDVPNIPAPVPPSRRPLEVKKRKDWSGFNHGKRDRFATYATAYLELAGSEEAQQMTAQGAAGVYILDREINAIGGWAQAYAGPEELYLGFEVKYFGQDLIKKELRDGVKIVDDDPSAWSYELDESYETIFMVGPVPVSVELGGRIDIGVGYEYGVYTTQIKGTLTPYVKAEGYASAAAGLPRVVQVGAEASLVIIDARLPLTGYGAVNFDEVGYPFLKFGIESRATYEAIKGRAFAFAKYLVPRWGMPPWKTKKSEYDIFKWDGVNGDHLIMNWGLELGRNGTKLSGELLDQTDRAETAALNEIIDLENRKMALGNLEVEVQQKVEKIFAGIQTDLGSEDQMRMINQADFLPQSMKNAEGMTAVYQQNIDGLFGAIF
ncbi:MAG TPA: hypothetical protein VE954_08745 [Oligoflexus sp.]|uniref:hypothetical protein n=1 Tax=Oligoflexus sp. TaxID=1971216 RepID=UPI002D68BD12|nr:hypothetical protein [Oligoflexus sp.]HYX33190.1 hypothetical protein [Oligoflexus sp.]